MTPILLAATLPLAASRLGLLGALMVFMGSACVWAVLDVVRD